MKTLSNLLYLFLLLLFQSCSNIVYYSAVPEGQAELKEFPPLLQGKYIDNEGDTLEILSSSYHYGHQGEMDYLQGDLNNELVLKEKNGFYFLNFKSDEGFWEMIAAQAFPDKLILYSIDTKNSSDIKIINDILKSSKAKSFKEEGKYIIKPSDDEIIQLLKQEQICEQSELKRTK